MTFFGKTMITLMVLLAVGAGMGAELQYRHRELSSESKTAAWLTAILPFAFGGFYVWCAALLSLGLGVALLINCRRRQRLVVYFNFSIISVFAMVLCYGLTVFWAADRGLARLGIVKSLPLLLYAFCLMQLDREEKENCLKLVPLSGAVMVCLSAVLQFFPIYTDSLIQSGRMSGFFEYANTFAMFLLAGIAVAGMQKKTTVRDILVIITLVFGVFASGSRFSLAFLALELVVICITRRSLKIALLLGAVLAFGGVASFAVSGLELFSQANRFVSEGSNASSLLCRMIYYKDALPVILRHPFGTGYMGYYTMQTSFQTATYHVVYVHNGLLQLLMDIGWLPTILLTISVILALVDRRNPGDIRLVLFLTAAYSMLDFHLEYLAIWFLVLPAMKLWSGRKYVRQNEKHIGMSIPVYAIVALSLWIGIGNFLYCAGYEELCSRVTPFYTSALEKRLQIVTDINELKTCAEKILSLNQYSTIGWDALANVAYGEGNVVAMIENKQKAIATAPYSLDEYLDYIYKLETCRRSFLAAGDTESAEVCKTLLLSVPDMLQQVLDNTDPIAWKLEHVPELTLPAKYQQVLDELK